MPIFDNLYNLNQTLHVLEFSIWDLGIGIENLEFVIWDLGLGIKDLGLGIWDLDSSWPTDHFDQLGVAQLSQIFILIHDASDNEWPIVFILPKFLIKRKVKQRKSK